MARHNFDNQLSSRTSSPIDVRTFSDLVDHLGTPDVSHMYHRYALELERTGSVDKASQNVKLAAVVKASQPRHSTDDALNLIKDLVDRSPRMLRPAEKSSGDPLTVNMLGETVRYSELDLKQFLADVIPKYDVTVLIDDAGPAIRWTPNGPVWTLPIAMEGQTEALNALYSFTRNDPDSLRRFISPQRNPVSLPYDQWRNEHVITSDSHRNTLAEAMMFMIGDPRVVTAVQAVVAEFGSLLNLFTEQPRIALPSQSLDDLRPPTGHRDSNEGLLRSLIDITTMDNPLIGAAVDASPTIRSGRIVFTGDPENRGSNLRDVLLPQGQTWIVLKREVLERTLMLAGPLSAKLPVPVSDGPTGSYATVAIGHEQIRDLSRANTWRRAIPARSDVLSDYICGRRPDSVEISSNLDRPTFNNLWTAVRKVHQGASDRSGITGSYYAALSSALFDQPLTERPAAITFGNVTTDDIEAIVTDESQVTSYSPRRRTEIISALNAAGIEVISRAAHGDTETVAPAQTSKTH